MLSEGKAKEHVWEAKTEVTVLIEEIEGKVKDAEAENTKT